MSSLCSLPLSLRPQHWAAPFPEPRVMWSLCSATPRTGTGSKHCLLKQMRALRLQCLRSAQTTELVSKTPSWSRVLSCLCFHKSRPPLQPQLSLTTTADWDVPYANDLYYMPLLCSYFMGNGLFCSRLLVKSPQTISSPFLG